MNTPMRWTIPAALALISAGALAQERPTFRSQSDLVVVHAMVEDRRGAAVSDLRPEHFQIYEDNYPQEISFFSDIDAPASIGLLIDNSTSMIRKREQVIAASVEFARLSNPEDEIFVLAFNERVREPWPPRILQESDLGALRRALVTYIAARGMTALYDALHAGLDRLETATHTRQVLVVISDGSDNASQATLDDTLARVRASSATIYTLALETPGDPDGNPRLLRRLSGETGGEAFRPRRIDDIAGALEHIARDIRATYTMGYVPTNQKRDGTLRKVRVVARHPDGRVLTVKTRSGYVAPRARTSEGGAGGR